MLTTTLVKCNLHFQPQAVLKFKYIDYFMHNSYASEFKIGGKGTCSSF